MKKTLEVLETKEVEGTVRVPVAVRTVVRKHGNSYGCYLPISCAGWLGKKVVVRVDEPVVSDGPGTQEDTTRV